MTQAVAATPASTGLRGLGIALAGSALLTLSAYTAVPIGPVPMTMQTFVVLLLGLFCGPVVGAGAVLAYVAEAAIGLPVLAGGKTLLTAGPTIGYIIGWLPSVLLAGWMARRGWVRGWRMAATLAVASAVVFVPGLLVLRAFLPDWPTTVAHGLTPFVAGSMVKAALAWAVFAATPARWRARLGG